MSTCAWCGAELDIDWVDVRTLSDPDPVPIPGRVTCPTSGCVPRCPICRGVVGDIHGPECGPIISAKLGDLSPCTISRADCGRRERTLPRTPTRPIETPDLHK